MGRRNAHRARAGGRREFFKRLMLEHPEYGELDPSAFPPPLITPPSSPLNEGDVPGTEEAFRPERLNSQTPRKDPPRSRKLVSRTAVSTFIPARAPTRPTPPSVGARRPAKRETDPTSTRILGSVFPNFEIHKTPQGDIITMST